jgi:hypothetical protein
MLKTNKRDMTKQEYFKMVREINNELRSEGACWARTYSEPRKKTSYRTKLYYIMYNPNGKVFDSLAAEYFVSERSNGLLQAKKFIGTAYRGCLVSNLVITPTAKLQ